MQPTFGNGRSFLVVSHSPYRDRHAHVHAQSLLFLQFTQKEDKWTKKEKNIEELKTSQIARR